WCPHSRSVIGDFESLAEENASRKDLWFLAVSVDKATDEKQYLTFLKEQNLKSLRHAYSGNAELDEAYLSYGLRNIPYFYLLSADGTILAEGDHPGDLF
ncbi:MAG: thioredoxin family protein, partial [Bdellovibrionales bacterium]|nr:thioredoxin family protein [Bdellovibrionales bacterium]